jgi:hypothetical protein
MFDEDGVGRDAAQELDEPLMAVYETHGCSRDGCDAHRRFDHSFDYTDADSRTQQIVEEAVRRSDVYSTGTSARDVSASERVTNGDAPQYATEHAEMIDYDGEPIVGIRVGDETVGYIYPSHSVNMSDGGPCYGHVDEATRLGI